MPQGGSRPSTSSTERCERNCPRRRARSRTAPATARGARTRRRRREQDDRADRPADEADENERPHRQARRALGVRTPGEAGHELGRKQRHGRGDVGRARVHAGQHQRRKGDERAAAGERVLRSRPYRGDEEDNEGSHRSAPLPQLGWGRCAKGVRKDARPSGRAIGAGWGVGRCPNGGQIARSSPRTCIEPFLLSTPDPAFAPPSPLRGEGAPPSGEIPRRRPMLGDQRIEVEPDRLPVDDPPFARDHHPVGPVRAAENKRGERIVRAREARLVELEQGEVGFIARPRSGRCRSVRGSAPSLQSPSAGRRDG